MTWPNPDAPAASGVTSPVTTDPLEFQGAVTFDKNPTINTVGSSSAAPRTLTFAPLGGVQVSRIAMNADVGGNNYDFIESGAGLGMLLTSYYGMQLRGSRATIAGITHGGATTDPGVSVVNTQTTAKAFVVKAIASQSANLQDWQDSSGSPLLSVTSAGALSIGADAHVLSDVNGTYAQFSKSLIIAGGNCIVGNGSNHGTLYFGNASVNLSETGSNRLSCSVGLGFWGVAPPLAKPAAPVTLADVIAVLQSYGMTA